MAFLNPAPLNRGFFYVRSHIMQRRQRRLILQMPTLHEALERYLREVSVKKSH